MKPNKEKSTIKHDLEINWNKAKNFIPKDKEIVIYDPDESIPYPRFKIGDGIHTVIDLPFYNNVNNDDNYFWNLF